MHGQRNERDEQENVNQDTRSAKHNPVDPPPTMRTINRTSYMVSPSLDASSVLPLPIAREPCGPSVRAGRVRRARSASSRALVWPLLLLPDRVALAMQVQDDAEGSLIGHLRAGVLTHTAGCPEVRGPTWRSPGTDRPASLTREPSDWTRGRMPEAMRSRILARSIQSDCIATKLHASSPSPDVFE